MRGLTFSSSYTAAPSMASPTQEAPLCRAAPITSDRTHAPPMQSEAFSPRFFQRMSPTNRCHGGRSEYQSLQLEEAGLTPFGVMLQGRWFAEADLQGALWASEATS